MYRYEERVRFWLGSRYFQGVTDYDRLIDVLDKSFGQEFPFPRDVIKGEGFWVICRPDQFARFMIFRNAAGITNGFMDLKAELLQPEKDLYTRISDNTGVPRRQVKKVLLSLDYSGVSVADQVEARQREVDVSGSR